MIDIRICSYGTGYLLTPVSEAGHDWLIHNTSNAWKWLRDSVEVDLRYVSPIVDCMLADDLHVEI